MKRITWLALSYQAPIEPSKNRVYIWRKLKEYGACYLKQGVALLPKSQQNLTCFRTLSQKIDGMGGEAVICEMKFVDHEDEQEMIKKFHSQSRIEYRELIDELTSLKKQISQNRSSDVSYDLARKIARRFGQARSRDYFRFGSEVSQALHELIGDMAYAADDLARFFMEILEDMED